MPVILLTDDEAVGGIEFDSRFGHWRCPHRQLSHRRKLRVNVQALSRESYRRSPPHPPAHGVHQRCLSGFIDRDGGYRLMLRRDAHRVFTAAQNCSVTAVVSSVTFQPFVSAFSLANFCSV